MNAKDLKAYIQGRVAKLEESIASMEQKASEITFPGGENSFKVGYYQAEMKRLIEELKYISK